MHEQEFQDILAQVQMPTRYAGNEINAVKKDLTRVDLTFALVFPDLYEIGTSHFGLQILYSILNGKENIAAERFFTPAPDMEAHLREQKIPCLSMESGEALKNFDIIGFSLLYELNFTNILTMLDLSRIPFYAADRDALYPLIIGGGPCAFNPEPLADFFDAFVIGDGEETIVLISDEVTRFKREGDDSKKSLLRCLSKIDGVYVPSFFDAVYDNEGIQTVIPRYEDYTSVKRAFLPRLTNRDFPTSPIVPFAKPVHDRLRLEIARGCSRGCRFCQAGMIYRPVRERSLEDLIDIATKSMGTTGYSDISLLSLSTGDYSRLSELMAQLLDLGGGYCNAISLPSVRAEKLTPQLMNIIKTVRKTGFTIAPEAGSQRLRDVVNKNLTEESIRSTVENAFNLGWKNIKLYFMMGLPFEKMADIEKICTFSTELALASAKGKKNINVSVAGFIPKSHTPFQRCAQMSLARTREKLQFLKDNLRHRKVKLKWQSPEMSMIEGVFARGDRRVSRLLVSAYEMGCRLDGWSDKFNYSLWLEAFEKTGIDPLFYTTRERTDDEALPWDHIDSGVSPRYLAEEFKKAGQRAATPDCREGDCTGCGVCDFETIMPVVNNGEKMSGPESPTAVPGSRRLDDAAFKKFEVFFSKLGPARFFGHLELATIVERAVKRAGFIVKYSQGFNPSMRLSFDNALPVGMESEEEILYIYLEKGLAAKAIVEGLNQTLPEGIRITGCRPFAKTNPKKSPFSTYTLCFPNGTCPGQEDVDAFLDLSEFYVEDLSKKGKIRRTDLRKSVDKMSLLDSRTLQMVLKPYNERKIRPIPILTQYFKLDETLIKRVRITRKATE